MVGLRRARSQTTHGSFSWSHTRKHECTLTKKKKKPARGGSELAPASSELAPASCRPQPAQLINMCVSHILYQTLLIFGSNQNQPDPKQQMQSRTENKQQGFFDLPVDLKSPRSQSVIHVFCLRVVGLSSSAPTTPRRTTAMAGGTVYSLSGLFVRMCDLHLVQKSRYFLSDPRQGVEERTRDLVFPRQTDGQTDRQADRQPSQG